MRLLKIFYFALGILLLGFVIA
ncbi:MAG: hypothetical protein CFH02_01067, partial [Alphaproteobacteria bacterium MarineAlpha3_Bin1]